MRKHALRFGIVLLVLIAGLVFYLTRPDRAQLSENAVAGIQSNPRLEAQQMDKLAGVVDMSEQGLALLQQFHGFCDTPLSSPKLHLALKSIDRSFAMKPIYLVFCAPICWSQMR